MKDEEILDLLRKSEAFNERLSREAQESIIQKIPTLTVARKLKLAEVLVKEQEALQKVAESQKKILANLGEALNEVIKRTIKKAKGLAEETERQKALSEIENELNKL
jgi:histone H3/H4